MQNNSAKNAHSMRHVQLLTCLPMINKNTLTLVFGIACSIGTGDQQHACYGRFDRNWLKLNGTYG